MEGILSLNVSYIPNNLTTVTFSKSQPFDIAVTRAGSIYHCLKCLNIIMQSYYGRIKVFISDDTLTQLIRLRKFSKQTISTYLAKLLTGELLQRSLHFFLCKNIVAGRIRWSLQATKEERRLDVEFMAYWTSQTLESQNRTNQRKTRILCNYRLSLIPIKYWHHKSQAVFHNEVL